MIGWLRRLAGGAPLSTEVIAGVTTFLTMSYIAVVNPAILSDGTGLAFSAVMTATVLTAALSSIAMGVWANLPYALAPGMGLNAFFTYSLIIGEGLTGGQALGAVVISGLLFVAISATPARIAVARAVPPVIRSAAACGIGLFLTFIGLKNAGVITGHDVTLVSSGALSIDVALFAGGLLVTAALLQRGARGALLLGIAVTCVAALATGRMQAPERVVASPDFSTVWAFDLGGMWSTALIAPLVTLVFTDLFDSLSTFLGLAKTTGLVDERGEPVRMGRALTIDAVASLASGVLGTSPATTYIESAAGAREGGRTGVTAVVCGLCFLPLIFLAPLAAAVPPFATAPALIAIGFFMMQSVREVAEADLVEALPGFLTMVLMPLTFSITQGLVWGILSYVVLHLVVGRAGRVTVTLWLVALACAGVLVADSLG